MERSSWDPEKKGVSKTVPRPLLGLGLPSYKGRGGTSPQHGASGGLQLWMLVWDVGCIFVLLKSF